MELSVVKEILTPYLESKNLKLFDVELVKEFGYLILRVSVDKEGGIDVDELALVNEYLSERIDKYDKDMPEYMLEVCSPGAEKPLRNLDEVKENIGAYVHLELPEGIFEGTLEDVNEENILVVKINLKGRFKKFNFPYENIKSIRLAVKL